MTTQGEKKSALKELQEYLPISIAIATISGFGYLFLYTAKHNLPFPLSLSSLPALLIVIMAVTVILILMFLCIVILPVLAKADTGKSYYLQLFDGNIFTLTFFKTYFIITGLCILFPAILLYITALFPNVYILKYYFWPLFLLLLLCPLSISAYFVWKKSVEHKSDTVAHVFLINIISFIGFFLFGLPILQFVLINISKESFKIGYPLGLSILIFINFILVTPGLDLSKYNNKKSFMIICSTIILFTLLVFPIGLFFTERSMSLLKLGGGYKSVFYIEKGVATNLPEFIMVDETKTKDLYVYLNIGDTKYVSLTKDPNKLIYGIRSKNIVAEVLYKE